MTAASYRSSVRRSIDKLREYADAWARVSELGQSDLADAANAVTVLREFGCYQRVEHKRANAPKADEVEGRGVQAFERLEELLRRLCLLLSAMRECTAALRSASYAQTEAEFTDAPILATLPAVGLEELADELVCMHANDLMLKHSIVDDLTGEHAHRQLQSAYVSAWITQPSVKHRRASFVLAAFAAELECAVDTPSSGAPSPRHEQGSPKSPPSAAVAFLLDM